MLEEGLDPDDLPPGTSLCDGQLVIEACLGRGGVATVYRVHTLDGRRLALKLMVARRAADEDQRERFENEWRILKALRGAPYVVEVEHSGRHVDGRPWFTMELVESPTLADLIVDRALSVPRACEVVRDVADALDDLHRRGVVHRDIKPDNIMVTPTGVRLLDFGYAYTLGSRQLPRLAGLTSREHRPGTPLYMAPEQAGGATPEPSFDIYALAVTLYEALVGHAPRSEIEPARMMMHKCSSHYDELSIAGRVLGLPERLERLVDHGLRRLPELRLRSAAAFRDELDALVAEMGDEQGAIGDVERTVSPLHVLEPPKRETRVHDGDEAESPIAAQGSGTWEEGAPRGRRSWSWVAAAVIVALGGGAWGVFAMPSRARVAVAEADVPPPRTMDPSSATERGAGAVRVPEHEARPLARAEPEIDAGATPVSASARRDRAEKKAVPRPPKASAPPSCTDVPAQADAASRSKQWSRVLELTRPTRCWKASPGARIELRMEALSELGRYEGCVALGAKSKDPEVARMARSCATQLDEEESM